MKAAMAVILLACLSRLIPHPANMTALTALAVLGPSYVSRRQVLVGLMFILLISDSLLAWHYQSSVFGSWSLFSYSGFCLIALLAPRSRFIALPLSSVFYWLWTNLGVWLSASLYPLTVSGFLSCYLAAIPFLRNALVGDLIWYAVLFLSVNTLVKADKFRYNAQLL